MNQPERLSHRRDTPGAARRVFGVRQCQFRVILQQRRRRDQVLGNSFGVLLRQRTEFTPYRTIQLLAGDVIG